MTIQRHTPRGFSLVEVLCSMAVGSLILFVAVIVLDNTGAGYERVGSGVAADREARAVLAQLATDLASARFHKDGVLMSSPATWPVDRLAFLCLQPDQAQSVGGRLGDLCAVHYYVKDLMIGGQTVRCLMRGYRESRETFQALERGEAVELFTVREYLDEPVAFGVVSFMARPKSRGPTGGWIEWNRNDPSGPAALEVQVVLARRELTKMLVRPADWDGTGAAASLLDDPAAVRRNARLEVCATHIPFGDHENPQPTSP